MDVVLGLRNPFPLMTVRGTDTRVLKWTFRRQHETVICQLGLNSDHSAYELRLNPSWDLQAVTTEIYEGAPPGLQDPINVVTFSEDGGRTALSILMVVESREVRDMIIDSGMEGGMQEGMDLLEQIARELA